MIQAIKTLLADHTGVRSIVGDRVFNRYVPQRRSGQSATVAPLLVLDRQGTERLYSLDGYSELASTSVIVLCVSETYSGLESLAAAVRNALLDVTGDIGNLRIQTIQLTNDVDDDELFISGSDRRYLMREMMFDVHWNEN